MEEAAMGGGDERLAVQRPTEGQRIEEEIDGVDMDERGLAEMAPPRRRVPASGAAADTFALARSLRRPDTSG